MPCLCVKHNLHDHRLRHAGFTLLETLVALSVLAISLGITYQAFSSALKGSGLAEDYAQASMYADSHLAEVGIRVNTYSRITEGAYNDRYRWKLEIIPLDQSSSRSLTEKVKRYKVTLNVYWRSGIGQRSISATTFRLASA